MRIAMQTGGMLPPLDILDLETIDDMFRRFKAAGFDGIDFNLNEGMSWSIIVNGEPDACLFDLPVDALCERLEPYAAAAKRYGLTFSQMHAPFPSYVAGGAAANARVLQAIEKSIAVCGTFGCQYLVVHPAFLDYGIAKINDAGKVAGVSLGAADEETMRDWYNRGARMISTGFDIKYIMAGARENLAAMQRAFGMAKG